MVVCMARQIKNYEMVAQGLATPLVTAAYLLASKTHAPNLYFASAIGQSLTRHPAPLGLTRVESLWLDRALAGTSFVRAAADILPRLKPKEFFRPAQVDPNGCFNNIAFGKDYKRPRLRLPGTGGIPDVTIFSSEIYLYVPRHSRVTFVPVLDFRSGLGYHPSRTHGHGPRYLISDLGQFDFTEGRLRLITVHPGITMNRIQAKTGFEFDVSPDIQQTPRPEDKEIRLLREEIDPMGIRRLELLSGAARRELLHEIIQQEK
jgi:glutaconate CoA-transferase, subunit B